MTDDLEDFLVSRDPAAPGDLRERVLRKTRGVLRRRRIVRRIGFIALLAGVYGAGAMTMHWTQSPTPSDLPIVKNEPVTPRREAEAATAPPMTPLAMEWQAIDNADARADLFRQAGDRYLAEFGDVESALRCYRNALDFGSTADAAVRPEDSWLMISLKQAKLKEKRHDALDG